MMSLKQLQDRFTIDAKIDIKPFFELEKTIKAEIDDVNICLNCKRKSGNLLKSSSWTTVNLCYNCKTLNVIYHQDKMGGIYLDTIELYKEKL